MIEIEDFWGPEYWPRAEANPPPPSAARVRQWEDERGVRLPALLFRVLAIQDGGYVRGTELLLFPLGEIGSLLKLGWDPSRSSEGRGSGDLSRMYRFGAEGISQAGLILDLGVMGGEAILWEPHESFEEVEEVEGTGTFEELIEWLRQQPSP